MNNNSTKQSNNGILIFIRYCRFLLVCSKARRIFLRGNFHHRSTLIRLCTRPTINHCSPRLCLIVNIIGRQSQPLGPVNIHNATTSRRVVVTEIAYRLLLKRSTVVARFHVDIITSNLFFSLFSLHSTRLPLSTFFFIII